MDAELLDILGLDPGTATLEAQVLGCLMAHGRDGLKKIDLADTDFSDPANQEIFRAMASIVEDGGDPESCAVRDRIPSLQGKIGICLQAVPTGQNLLWHTDQLKRAVFSREEAREKSAAADLIRLGKDHTEVWANATAVIASLRDRYLGKPKEAEFAQSVNEVMALVRAGKAPENVLRVGIPWLDWMTRGLAAGENCVLAARPGCGKTDLALNIAVKLAQSGIKTTLFSFEMMAQQLVERVASMLSGVDCTRAIRDPKSLHDQDRRQLLGFHAAVAGVASVMEVQTRMDPTIAEIGRLARKSVEAGSRLLIVDYLQLMRAAGRSRNEEIEGISREWKNLLKELEVPGIMLSQLSRSGEKERRHPRLSDLRDSGSIEQDADYVWFLHREESKAGPDKTFFIQEKSRQVARGSCQLRHTGADHWLMKVDSTMGDER